MLETICSASIIVYMLFVLLTVIIFKLCCIINYRPCRLTILILSLLWPITWIFCILIILPWFIKNRLPDIIQGDSYD
jgi:hypothetical protein